MIKFKFTSPVGQPRVEDGGQAKIVQLDDDKEEGLFVRLHSWSKTGQHPELDSLIGKIVRITIEEI